MSEEVSGPEAAAAAENHDFKTVQENIQAESKTSEIITETAPNRNKVGFIELFHDACQFSSFSFRGSQCLSVFLVNKNLNSLLIFSFFVYFIPCHTI